MLRQNKMKLFSFYILSEKVCHVVFTKTSWYDVKISDIFDGYGVIVIHFS